MQGTIAQIVALAAHGNSILQGLSESQAFQSQNSTFTFCESVDFVEAPQGVPAKKAGIWAANLHDWFERLRKANVHTLKIRHGPSGRTDVADRILVGFVGGGGRWLIETRSADRADYWEARWQVGNRERPDKKIWRVSYVRIHTGNPSAHGQADNLTQLKAELRECLGDIADFSRSHKLDWFTAAFESGITRLDSNTPLEGLYHQDIVPPGFLSLPANQLLGSAEAAWVFGGMGSWNDQSFEGESRTRYEELSESLFRLLNRAIVASVNSNTDDAKRTLSRIFGRKGGLVRLALFIAKCGRGLRRRGPWL